MIAYASTSAEIVTAVNNSFVSNVNSSYDFWFWLFGMIMAAIAITLFYGGFKLLFKTLFGVKGRRF